MRIVAGRHRGRPLGAPRGLDVRPTADRVREAVFNVLAHGQGLDIAGASVVDLFAGAGAMGLEALSRGAGHVVFVERAAAALAALQANIGALGEGARCTVLRRDARAPGPPPAAAGPCALAVLDPPYGEALAEPALVALVRHGWLAPDAVAAVELDGRDAFAPPPGFTVLDDRRWGRTRVVFLRHGG